VRSAALARRLVLDAEDALRRQIRALAVPDDILANVRVVTGEPSVEIIRSVREHEAELLVVGAHGEQFFKDSLLGTTAETVVRNGDRPVLVVKRPTRGPYRRVLVGVDFSESSRNALELALCLAAEAQFHILHVYPGLHPQLRRAGVPDAEIARHARPLLTQARKDLGALLARIDTRGKHIRKELSGGRAHHDIARTAKRTRADLVAVGTTGRSGLPYVLLGSVAERVLQEVACDVLVAPAKPGRFKLP
jgi:nucleotide-binding universal stress UspA family protein